MPINIREIAKLAGVSSATVSRVLNESTLVTRETTAKVQKIIRDLNFVPNNSAIQFKHGKSNIYGIIIPDITNPFYTDLVKTFEGLLVENHLDLIVANTDFHPTRTQHSVQRMLLRRVDGVAILPSEYEMTSLSSLVQNRIPVVTADYYRTAPGMSDITVDFVDGMMQLATHLKKLGHRNLGFISGSSGPLTSRVRTEAFLNAIMRQGMSSRDGWIVEGNYRIDGGAAAMAKILSQPQVPTAVITANDLMAFGALRTAHEMNFRVPEDISIAGCDDLQLSAIVHPPLTTLRIPHQQYARAMFDALKTSGENLSLPGKQYSIPMFLVIRESTGRARGGSSTVAKSKLKSKLKKAATV